MVELNNSEDPLYVLDAIKDGETISSILISKFDKNIIYLIGWSNKKGEIIKQIIY